MRKLKVQYTPHDEMIISLWPDQEEISEERPFFFQMKSLVLSCFLRNKGNTLRKNAVSSWPLKIAFGTGKSSEEKILIDEKNKRDNLLRKWWICILGIFFFEAEDSLRSIFGSQREGSLKKFKRFLDFSKRNVEIVRNVTRAFIFKLRPDKSYFSFSFFVEISCQESSCVRDFSIFSLWKNFVFQLRWIFKRILLSGFSSNNHIYSNISWIWWLLFWNPTKRNFSIKIFLRKKKKNSP